MTEQERYAVSQEERKEKIRARYKGVDRSELEFIPAKQKEKLFEDTGTKRVCAYCRVSTDDVNQTSSYELQKNHYEDMIKEHQGWELVGIYADEGISGTSLQHRDEFNQMIEDCKAGKIDLIVTKSVSRFARNIVDCIAKVRELANMRPQVGVFFETEHIYTLDNTSEMMLAVLSAAAQEESHTKSEIMNISIEQRFSRGIFLTPKLLGYDIGEDGNLVINEEEAETVRLCYYLFLNGFPTAEIADILTQLKRKTKPGNTKWSSSSIVSLLRNERYCGDVLSRKTFTPNYLDHKAKKNRHDRNQYRQSDHHEAIIDRDIYNAAQKMLTAARYAKKGFPFPNLKVVDEGALKGFVSVNRSWTGFTGEDYEKASQSVYSDQTDINDTEKEERKDSGFDLSGYEIVRAQFFSTRLNPAMTISEGKVTFNTACLKKFENVEYVEILFNSVEKCIAVRPCDKDDINAVKWGTIRNGKWAVLPKSCKGFSEPLFDLMNWNDECKYRFRGQYSKENNEQILLFDLEEPEVIKHEIIQEDLPDVNTSEGVKDTENKEENKTKKIVRTLFPKQWKNHFGCRTEEVVLLHRVKYCGNWDVLRSAKTVEGMEVISENLLKKLDNEAQNMIEKMRCAV
jgi:site-specific DNA recombinase